MGLVYVYLSAWVMGGVVLGCTMLLSSRDETDEDENIQHEHANSPAGATLIACGLIGFGLCGLLAEGLAFEVFPGTAYYASLGGALLTLLGLALRERSSTSSPLAPPNR